MQILGGIHQRKKLFVPKTNIVRPTLARLKRSIFDILQDEIEGKKVLDLFAGVGGLGFEAISRGAFDVTFVESEPLCLKALSINAKALGETRRSRIFASDVLEMLSTLSKRNELFDIIFADPPYGKGYGRRILVFLDRHALLKDGGSLFIEERFLKDETLPEVKNFQLKSERSVGKTSLLHFIKI